MPLLGRPAVGLLLLHELLVGLLVELVQLRLGAVVINTAVIVGYDGCIDLRWLDNGVVRGGWRGGTNLLQ